MNKELFKLEPGDVFSYHIDKDRYIAMIIRKNQKEVILIDLFDYNIGIIEIEQYWVNNKTVDRYSNVELLYKTTTPIKELKQHKPELFL